MACVPSAMRGWSVRRAVFQVPVLMVVVSLLYCASCRAWVAMGSTLFVCGWWCRIPGVLGSGVSMSLMLSDDFSGSVLPSVGGLVMVRVRVPGGRVRSWQWEVLADLCDEFGDGWLYLTSRGNLQVRGVRDAQGLVGRLVECGLGWAPSVMCSPLSPGLGEFVDELVSAVSSVGAVFGVDSGDGAIIAECPDVGLLASGGSGFQLVLSGEPTGLVVGASSVAALGELVESRGHEAGVLVPAVKEAGLVSGRCEAVVPPPPVMSAPIGWMQEGETVALGAGLQLGQLDSRLARFLAAIGTDTWITPWNSLVIHGLSEGMADEVVKVLAPMGLIFDVNSPWLRVSACGGSAVCLHAHADVRSDLELALGAGQLSDVEGQVYFSGCGRRCGHPVISHREYQATADEDYEVFER